jgi:hypothetical protein
VKREVPVFICFLVGLILISAAFIPRSPFNKFEEEVSVYFDIIAVFAFILGGGNLIRVHGNKIYKRVRDWQYSIVTVIGFLAMLIAGVFKLGGPPGVNHDLTAEGAWFKTLYDSVFTPLMATTFALLAFFVASASYRAFRAKTKEATMLLLAAFIILMGRTPVGGYLTGWIPERLSYLQIPAIANWIMAVPNLAGQRAIMIGIALGIISMSLRLILGIERSYLGAERE